MASSNPQGEVSASRRNDPVHRPSPPSNDGRYRKTDASVTGPTHANHRSARSPRPTPEGPARDNLIAGPRTGTTRSEPSAPASAGASGRHNEPGSRPASACPAQPPSKAGGASPPGGERHHGVRKANRSTEGDTAPAQVPSKNSCRPDRRVRAWQRTQPLPATEQPPSGWTGARPEGNQPLPATKQPPSGWTSARLECTQPLPTTNSSRPDGRVCALQRPPAHATHGTPHRANTPVNRYQGARTPYARRNTPSGHTGEQEPSGPGHRTPNTAHRAGTPVNRSQVAQDTVHATRQTDRAHRCTGAKGPRTPHTQHNTRSGHTGEQEPSGPGHRKRNTTHRAGTPQDRSQGAQDTAHQIQHTEQAHMLTGAKGPKIPYTQHNKPIGHTGEQEPTGPRHRTRNTTNRAGTPVKRSQGAQDTAHPRSTPSGHTSEQEPRGQGHGTRNTRHGAGTPVTRANRPRTPHTQHNTPSGHSGEQEPSGPGHPTRNTAQQAGAPMNRSQVAQATCTSKATHRAGASVNRSQLAQDTAQANQRTERAHR